jgi:mRNA interferase HicA
LLYTELAQQRGEVMSYNEFKRWLKARGVRFESLNGTSHFKIYFEGKQTIFPDHGAKEMKEGTRKGIIKQLGLK